MKKYGILLGAGALLCALCLVGCSGQQETYETQTYSVEAAQIEAIEIDVTDRKIAVAYSPDDQIHLTYYESSRQQYDIEAQDGVLTLRSADDKQWTDFIGGKPERTYRTITLELPRTLEASLSLKTTNEGLQLPALSLSGDLLVAVNQGGIEMEAVECGGPRPGRQRKRDGQLWEPGRLYHHPADRHLPDKGLPGRAAAGKPSGGQPYADLFPHG